MRTLFLFILIFSYQNIFCQDIGTNIYYINSDPSNAKVFINDSLYGTTPLKVNNFKIYSSVKLVDSLKDTWRLNYGAFDSTSNSLFALIGKNYGLLNIYSNPSGAKVYFNDSLVGSAPLKSLKIPLGTTKIKLQKKGYQDFEGSIFINKEFSQLFNFNFKLQSIYGKLDFTTVPSNENISVDDKKINTKENGFIKIIGGMHNFEYENVLTKKNKNKDFNVEPDKKYKVVINKNQFYSDALIESIIIPGLGQMLDDSHLDGAVIFACTAGLGVAAVNSLRSYTNNENNYDIIRKQYLDADDELSAINTKQLLNAAQDKMNKSLTSTRILWGLFIGAYIYNIVDVILWHTHRDVLRLLPQDNFNLTGQIDPVHKGIYISSRLNF